MKFRKLLVGLMGLPFLLTSCNNSISFDQAKKWIEENYPKTKDKQIRTVPIISWDFSGTDGDDATKKVDQIFEELPTVAINEEIHSYIIPRGEDLPAIGGGRIIPGPEADRPTQMMYPLIAEDFKEGTFSDNLDDDVYKINDGCFSVTYKKGIECFGKDEETGEYNVFSTCVRVFNKSGYCTDYGYKANKYMSKGNIVKFKFLIHFEYENDPID